MEIWLLTFFKFNIMQTVLIVLSWTTLGGVAHVSLLLFLRLDNTQA